MALASCAIRCTTTRFETAQPGIQAGYSGFVPARIAVLPCRAWPDQTSLVSTWHSNVSAATLAELCARVDRFVLQSFVNQPYMNGFTPKLVSKMMRKAGHKDYMSEIDDLWRVQVDTKACNYCAEPSLVYERLISRNPPWGLWLKRLSENTKYCDATLLPLLTNIHEGTADDRGLLEHRRHVSVFLMLIDTNSGRPIWTGKRQSTISSKLIKESTHHKTAAFPKWSVVMGNLLTEQLWEEFPGRMTY